MNTYAMQVLLHFQSQSIEDARFDALLEDLKGVAERHGVTLDDHQSMQLPGAEYSIRACDQCRHLTVNRDLEMTTQACFLISSSMYVAVSFLNAPPLATFAIHCVVQPSYSVMWTCRGLVAVSCAAHQDSGGLREAPAHLFDRISRQHARK